MSGDVEWFDNDIWDELNDIANARYFELDMSAAGELIRDAFRALPWDLQADYQEIARIHRQGRFDEANALWRSWIDDARDYGLL